MGLEKALIHSVNTYFAEKTVELGSEKLEDIMKRFYFDEKIPFDLPVATSKSSFSFGKVSKTELAATSFGQGKTLVSPIHMALVASTIYNDGIMPKPKLVSEITSPQGILIEKKKDEELKRVIPKHIANTIYKYMNSVINYGSNASIRGEKVFGKTGTAENASGKTHAWFIGGVEKGKNSIVLSVILEEEGKTGGSVAAPIARRMMIEGLKSIK